MRERLIPDLPILLVDDDEPVLKAIRRTFAANGLTNILALSDGREVMPCLGRQEVAIVLLDLTMPHVAGIDLLARIVADHPHIPVVIATATDNIEVAVQCMRLGAFDYIVKPIDTARLLSSTRSALEVRELRRENQILRNRGPRARARDPEAFGNIITNNEKMLAIFSYVEAIAATTQPVMITGETGVGKELIARTVHTLSKAEGLFVAVNVSGLDDTVFADTMFGHVKGTYTGAEGIRGGQVKRAAGGTLFLDEIGELSLVSQLKLLRLVQEREYLPLGSDQPQFTDARIITATNRDFDELVKSGAFRKDLYFRLHAHEIHLPPLRERRDDIPLLLNHFLAEVSQELGRKIPAVPKEIFPLLAAYDYPGNIREFRSLVFEAMSKHSSDLLSLEVFRQAVGNPPYVEKPAITFGAAIPTLKEARILLIEEALRRTNRNITSAARLLGITRQSLSEYLRNRDLAP